MELLCGKSTYGANISGQKNNIKAALKRLFRQHQKSIKTLSVLNVHGNITFNTHLAAAIPESAGFVRIPCGLRDFRSKPCFDILFYSHAQNRVNNLACILEDLCYCRMLLRPGAFLFLVIEEKRNREASWLRQAGFANITTQKMGNEFVLVGGQRPLQKF